MNSEMTDWPPPGMLTILEGDVIEQLHRLPEESIHCCVTSPPYWGLRDYGVAGQIGLEPTPDCGLLDFVRMRSDLTESEIEFVLKTLLDAELLDGVIYGKASKV